jgi:hypothetical protein
MGIDAGAARTFKRIEKSSGGLPAAGRVEFSVYFAFTESLGSPPPWIARMAELADARDSKSRDL